MRLDQLRPFWDLRLAFKCAVTCSWCSKSRKTICFCVFVGATVDCLDIRSDVRLSCSQFRLLIQSILSACEWGNARPLSQTCILKPLWGFKVPVRLQIHNKTLRLPPKVLSGSTTREISTPEPLDISDDEVCLLSPVRWMTGMCLKTKKKNDLAVELGRISPWRCWTFPNNDKGLLLSSVLFLKLIPDQNRLLRPTCHCRHNFS